MPESVTFGEGEESKKSEKERVWENKLKELGEAGDALGLGIDERIKEVVGAFNVHDFNTNQSCEGHVDRGFGAPWISIEAPSEPEERFVNEKKVFEEVAHQYNISYEDVKRSNNHEAWIEALKLSSQNEETPEFKAWHKEGEKLRERLEALIKEFYKDRQVETAVGLEVEGVGAQGAFRVYNGGKDYSLVENMSQEQKNGLEERLPEYRKEMQAFGNFLKDKFLSE